jgi:hypothetical protein
MARQEHLEKRLAEANKRTLEQQERAERATSHAHVNANRVAELRVAVVELLKANVFGMSVTSGWDDARKDSLYLQCAEADRLGRAALELVP